MLLRNDPSTKYVPRTLPQCPPHTHLQALVATAPDYASRIQVAANIAARSSGARHTPLRQQEMVSTRPRGDHPSLET